MNVRCKMRVVSKTERANYDPKVPGKSQSTVKLQAMSDPDNQAWSKFTPSGSVDLCITNQAAIDAFDLGECYYVDFSKAPAKDVTQ